jgi:ubiquinone/menaquinone biosynthesis C-methylase UbiE
MRPPLSAFDVAALWLGRAVLTVLGGVLLQQTVLRLIRRVVHFPAPPFISVFLDSSLRKALQPPEEVLTRAGLGPGMTVLELGPGPGAFTIEAARRVGPAGRVIAVDVQPQMLERLRAKAMRFGVDNVEVHQADAYHLPAADGSVDVVYTVTVLPEIPDRARALAEVRRVLKPGGLFSDSELLLDPDWPRRRTVRGWCEAAGFRLTSENGGLLEYTLNFVRPA